MFLNAFTQLFLTGRHQQRFVHIVLDLLKENVGLSQGVDYFANRSASSRRTFFRIFEERDTSFGELLKYIRLLRFLKLCSNSKQANTRPSVSSLIFQAGFNDVSNFNHLFKAHFGVAPGALIAKSA
jgi:AraC-like DNA-binding protein